MKNKKRVVLSEKIIINIVDNWSEVKLVTQTSIGDVLGVSRWTVAKYWTKSVKGSVRWTNCIVKTHQASGETSIRKYYK